MKKIEDQLILSASDLVGHLNCGHLTALDIQVATGSMPKPDHYDPLLEILRERGHRHEAAYIDHLKENGFDIEMIEGVDITDGAVEATLKAMTAGKEIIIQGSLRNGRWRGRADVLRRTDKASNLGSYGYEIIDTKLARETKGGTVLQLCLYADLLESMQGVAPDYVYVVAPWSDFEPQSFRYADYSAYYRQVKKAAEDATIEGATAETYPNPKSHCDICRWENQCDARRRKDDHLCLVAGITKNQISELQLNGFGTTEALAGMPSPMPFKPKRGSLQSFEKARGQAAIQMEGRRTGEYRYTLLDVVPEFGLSALPEPSEGDVFLDIEGDEFVGQHGLEYLFGYTFDGDDGETQYIGEWAFDREGEKLIFERFIDFVASRRKAFPDMHIYHFGSYEPGAIKRLMGRYATREDDVDNLLRGLILVDLLSVIRNAMRASVESYSLKSMEPFFGFKRTTALRDANIALTKVSAGLELNDVPSIDDATKEVVASYNRDDCLSTAGLRQWLETIRTELVEDGTDVPRPVPGQEGPSQELDEQQKRIQALVLRLTHDVPVDPEERTAEQQARWILAYILDWHRRENKATWWEYFRLKDLSGEELLDEKAAIGRLQFVGTVEQSKQGIPIDRYTFEAQDTDIRADANLHNVGGDKIGTAVAVSPEDRTIDIKKSKATAGIHPEAVYSHKIIGTEEQAASLFRLGEYVADHGMEGDGDYRSAREILLRTPMDTFGQAFQEDGEITLDAALRLTALMNGGAMPIQGPPGTGKSFTGARMICELIKQGKTVGITANSHKVIRNLVDKAIEAATKKKVNLVCIQKPESGHKEDATDRLIFAKDNDAVITAISADTAQLAAATHFFWSRADAKDLVDVLIVDEAGQMSLANVLAVAQAARTVILLGDPQQLEQPTQGTHPDGTGISALDHLLSGAKTISKDQGLFLAETYRLHPSICSFNSELFYEDKLESVSGCELQSITSTGAVSGSGLRFLPVRHEGNTSASIEEAEAIKGLVEEILGSGSRWTDRDGTVRDVKRDDILIIAPYNAQVFEIQQRLPDARVGTVDKFQGQEAPIAIYSMATSSHADAPRGMEFLYSANRFNVAISRAKCVAVLVASPNIFQAECRTPRQMQLSDAFCRYLELSEEIRP